MDVRRWVAALALLPLLAGCSLDGRGNLPFSTGVGDDAYTVRVEMGDVANLVPNAEVKVNDVTVGTVTSIRARNWRAELQVSLPNSVVLPRNAIANVGQKSLLGAQYLQLAAPATTPDPIRLAGGDVIPLNRTGTYPATEDLLIATSTFLNGSGLTQLKTITTELNTALDGRTDDIRALLENLRKMSARLAEQRQTIAVLLDRMDGLTGSLARQAPRIERSLPDLGPGLAALESQRPQLVKTLRAVNELDSVATPLLATNGDTLAAEVRRLQPVLSQLSDAAPSIPGFLNVAGTVLYPLDFVPLWIKGDYLNLFASLNLDPQQLQKGALGGTSETYQKNTVGAPNLSEVLLPPGPEK